MIKGAYNTANTNNISQVPWGRDHIINTEKIWLEECDNFHTMKTLWTTKQHSLPQMYENLFDIHVFLPKKIKNVSVLKKWAKETYQWQYAVDGQSMTIWSSYLDWQLCHRLPHCLWKRTLVSPLVDAMIEETPLNHLQNFNPSGVVSKQELHSLQPLLKCTCRLMYGSEVWLNHISVVEAKSTIEDIAAWHSSYIADRAVC